MRLGKYLVFGIGGCLGAAFFAGRAEAATIDVTFAADRIALPPVVGTGCSLREAIFTASGGGPIAQCTTGTPGGNVIQLRPNTTYTVTMGFFVIGSILGDLTMQGAGGSVIRNGDITVGSDSFTGFKNIIFDRTPIVASSYLNVDRCVMKNNDSRIALWVNWDASAYVADSWIHDNTGSPAVSTAPTGHLEMVRSTVSNNGAGGFDLSGNTDLTRCTVRGNSGPVSGAGIRADQGAVVTLTACTIMENTSQASSAPGSPPTNGGGFFLNGAYANLFHSIIALNHAPANSGNDCGVVNGGSVGSAGMNLVGQANGSNPQCPIAGTTDDQIGTPSSPIIPDICGFGSAVGPAPVSMKAYLPLRSGFSGGNGNLIDQVFAQGGTDQVGNRTGVVFVQGETPDDIGSVERQLRSASCSRIGH